MGSSTLRIPEVCSHCTSIILIELSDGVWEVLDFYMGLS